MEGATLRAVQSCGHLRWTNRRNVTQCIAGGPEAAADDPTQIGEAFFLEKTPTAEGAIFFVEENVPAHNLNACPVCHLASCLSIG